MAGKTKRIFIDVFLVKSFLFLQRGLADSIEITKDAELEAAAQAAAGAETGKKQQKGVAESVLKKKPTSMAMGKPVDKQATVSIYNFIFEIHKRYSTNDFVCVFKGCKGRSSGYINNKKFI